MCLNIYIQCTKSNQTSLLIQFLASVFKPGSVFYVDEAGKVKRQFVAEGCIRKMLFYDEKNILVTVTENLMLTLHNVTSDGETLESLKVNSVVCVKLCGSKFDVFANHVQMLCNLS